MPNLDINTITTKESVHNKDDSIQNEEINSKDFSQNLYNSNSKSDPKNNIERDQDDSQ